jgi:glycosyltransferase involved in cell wall biosynthesis
MSPELSIVIPAYNERDSLPALLEELDPVAREFDGCEVIVVDDGSSDGTGAFLEAAAVAHPALVPVRLARNLGKSAALAAGFARSRGEIVVTIDADGQDAPAEIPMLVAELERGYDLVSGWKQDRQDPWSRRTASRLFNRVTARVSGVDLHDFNCGLKAYRGDRIRSLDLYGELHRFIPVLGAQRGWRIGEIPVAHRARVHGASKFGLERYARGMLDLMAVTFMGRYENRPLHLFGGLGMIFVALGVIGGAYLTIEKIAGEAIGGRPLLLLSVLLIVVGFQFVTFGLISQMLVAMRHERSGRPDWQELPSPREHPAQERQDR